MLRTFAQGGAPASNPDTGQDLDGQVQAGLQAFAQSQDPQIAVEICNMLVQMYGIMPESDPYAEQAATSDVPVDQVPMARKGIKIYKNGGKVRKYAVGGPVGGGPGKNTAPEKKAGPAAAGPRYANQNPALTPAVNQQNAERNIARAQAFKNGLAGTPMNPAWDMRNPNTGVVFDVSDVQPWQQVNTRYNPVNPSAVAAADSVLGTGPAVRANAQRLAATNAAKRVYKNGGKVGGPGPKKADAGKTGATTPAEADISWLDGAPTKLDIDAVNEAVLARMKKDNPNWDPNTQFLPQSAMGDSQLDAVLREEDFARRKSLGLDTDTPQPSAFRKAAPMPAKAKVMYKKK